VPAYADRTGTASAVRPGTRPPAAGPPKHPQPAAACTAYYRGKTAAIIERYGPGPRVHYHIGLFGADDDLSGPVTAGEIMAEEIRAAIVTAQERLLERAADVWLADEAFSGDLLDVGCGLGGGAIYWAQHFGAQVTALTNVAEHAEVVNGFAAAAGVADRVRPLVADVTELMPTGRYAAAVALESSCYMPRPQLFQRVAAVLEPGAVFGIEDIFLARPGWDALFDGYWKTTIGTVAQYQNAAAHAGLELERDLDITDGTAMFWRCSMAWARSRLAVPGIGAAEAERLMRSVSWHSQFLRGWLDGAYRVRILRFRKRG
jgi:SAM-dependent methyltransferase